MLPAVILVILAIVLFVASNRKWIHTETLQNLANIAGIVALLAAILVFVIPAPTPTNEVETFFRQDTITFNHNEVDGLEWFDLNQSPKNFAIETDFINPYSANENSWNAVIFFRDGIRVYVNSDNTWGSGYFDENSEWQALNADDDLPQGVLKLEANDRNHLKLAVKDTTGCFYVNQRLVGSFDLAATQQSGGVYIGIEQHDPKVNGAVTKFENIILYSNTTIDC